MSWPAGSAGLSCGRPPGGAPRPGSWPCWSGCASASGCWAGPGTDLLLETFAQMTVAQAPPPPVQSLPSRFAWRWTMRRLLLGLGAVGLLAAAVAWSGPGGAKPDLEFRSEKQNPVTHLKLNNDPGEFQFAVVSDRTGGHRAKVFSRAVKQLNLLQPEFVVSVGDLI